MSSSYRELLEQRRLLESRIAGARRAEFHKAVERVRTIVLQYGVTQEEVFGTCRRAGGERRPAGSVQPKFRNPATGDTWSGRGKPPRWISDHDRAPFIII